MNEKYRNYLGFFVIFTLLGGLSAAIEYGTAAGIFFMVAAIAGAHISGWGMFQSPSDIRGRCAVIMIGCCICYPLTILLSQGMIKGTTILGMDNVASITRPFKKTTSNIKFIVVSTKNLMIHKGYIHEKELRKLTEARPDVDIEIVY